MESSDSDNENDCFESAEESIDEEERNDLNLELNASSPEREDEFSEHISAHCNTVKSALQVNDEPGNSVLYRKRPEKVKHLHSKPSSKPVSRPTDEPIFKADKIVPDALLQDITSSLTKNINRSLSTLQQTSCNVKELILSTIPVSSCSNNERFSYDDKDLTSTSQDIFQGTKHLELTGNMGDNFENKEDLSMNKLSTKEINFSLVGRKSDNVENTNLSDIRPGNLENNSNNIQESCNLAVLVSEDFIKKEKCNLKQQQTLQNFDSTFLNFDIAKEEPKESDEEKPEITADKYSVSPISKKVKSLSTEISESNDQEFYKTICKNSLTETTNSLMNELLQNKISQDIEDIPNELMLRDQEIKDKKDFLSEKLVSLAISSNSSTDQNMLNSLSESTDYNEGLVTYIEKCESNVSEKKCNLKELKTALKNIIKEEKSSAECENEYFNENFQEGELIFKGKNVENKNSEERWEDFDFSDPEDENQNQNFKEANFMSIDVKKENKQISYKQIKTNKVFTATSANNKMEEQESKCSEDVFRKGNLKTSSMKSCCQAVIDESSDKYLIVKDKGVVKENKENLNDVVESNPASYDAWDWDVWEERPEPSKEITLSQVNKNSEYRASQDESIDLSKWSGWDNFGQKSEEKPGNWSLGSWGVDAILNKATSVTQGISNVLEAGLGAPDPETLARMEKMEKENMRMSSRMDEAQAENQPLEIQKKSSLTNVSLFPVSGITSLVAEVTSKIVEHSKIQEIGSKVITGGLDTLETFGKKTMEVLQEGDPGLKNKRALLLGDQKPILSQVLKEAREKAERELKKTEERELAKKCHFETLFDDFQGLVHLEALEMLSRQYELKLEQLRSGMNSEEQEEFNAILEEVEQLCSLDESDMDLKTSSKLDFKIKLQMAVEPLKNEISIHQIIQIHEEVSNWLQSLEVKPSFSVINQKLVSMLAQFAAATVQQFHKSGELLSVKECRKTVEEVDALLRLTNVLCTEMKTLCEKFILFAKGRSDEFSDEKMKSLSENVTNIMMNSTSYIRQAFHLLIPVLQFGAAVY